MTQKTNAETKAGRPTAARTKAERTRAERADVEQTTAERPTTARTRAERADVERADVGQTKTEQTSAEETTGVPEPRATEEEFRAAMSRLAGGVALLAAHDPEEGVAGEDVGMTATAFMSVSLDPPLVLVSVRTGARMDDALERQPLWAVSVLSEEQRHVAGRFAMRGRLSDRLLFADLRAERGAATGAPLVPDALAVVECRTQRRVPAGDHTLVIGEVLTARTPHPSARPLVHFRSRYHVLG